VALGSEDIVRLASQSISASAVVSWVRNVPSIPLVATNIAIRKTREGLNIVDADRFQLHVSADSTHSLGTEPPVSVS